MEFVSRLPLWLADALMEATLRSLILAIAALALMWVLRIRSAASRHALWTIVTLAMLLMPVLSSILPSLPLRVLPAASTANLTLDADPPHPTLRETHPSGLPMEHQNASTSFPWMPLLTALYSLGLLASLAFLHAACRVTRRLVHTARPIQLPAATAVYQSDRITVPVTFGFRHPKILLPAAWRDWPAEKLAAVMTHEQLHVRRADWPIALLAALNRCVFWFHPLAWWLERHLATLAEHACDDAALLELQGPREVYAQVLLDMASAVTAARGRIVSGAIAMARTAEVRTRIERILDETRQLSGTLTRFRFAGLLACALPVVYLAVGMHLVQRSSTAREVPLASAHAPGPAVLLPDHTTNLRAPRSIAALSRKLSPPIALQSGRAASPQPTPEVATQPDPANSPTARIPVLQILHHGKQERSARLTLTVTAGGKIHDLYSSRSQGVGMDEKAAEVAREALFGPVPRAAIPFARRGTLDVPFRLVALRRRHMLGVLQPFTRSTWLPIPARKLLGPDSNLELREDEPWAKFLGTVTLSVTANAAGVLQSVQVMRALGPAFDENAIEAIRQWYLQPIYSIGPANLFAATIEVDFRLM